MSMYLFSDLRTFGLSLTPSIQPTRKVPRLEMSVSSYVSVCNLVVRSVEDKTPPLFIRRCLRNCEIITLTSINTSGVFQRLSILCFSVNLITFHQIVSENNC